VSHADHCPLNAISVCSGIGGLDLAVERVFGARVVALLEREAYAQAVLLDRMEAKALVPAPIFFDVTRFDGRPFRGLVDLVFGGIPCQPHSVAGKQRRGDDDRDLIDEFLRIVGEVGPKVVFVENVRGFVARDGIGRLLGGLADLGFDAEWEVVQASEVGAPHRRARVFVLAYQQHEGLRLQRKALDHNRRHAHRLDPDRCDEAMADALSCFAERRGEPRELAEEEEGGGLHHRPEQPDSQLGNFQRTGLEERGRLALPRSFPAPWPPGPQGDWSGVPQWCWPSIESGFRGVDDGLPPLVELAQQYRTDRLRCLGNAVVPQQAEAALRMLIERTLGHDVCPGPRG
jgi:DNA (cytosine-5)-methyltransferase 1